MRIDVTEKGSRQFYEEIVNAVCQYKALIRKPDRKLKNMFKEFQIYSIISIVMLAIMGAMALAWGLDAFGYVAMGLLAVAALGSICYLFVLKNTVKKYLEDDRKSVITLDDNGVEINKQDSQIVRISWDNVAFVRIFDESVCFFSKDITGFIISVIRTHEEEILEYLRDYKPDVKLIA
jgi:hypothetical protein